MTLSVSDIVCESGGSCRSLVVKCKLDVGSSVVKRDSVTFRRAWVTASSGHGRPAWFFGVGSSLVDGRLWVFISSHVGLRS